MNEVSNFRHEIDALQELMFSHPDKTDIKVKHHFAHDVYAREMFIPSGASLIGKIHKHACINVLTKGRMTVVTEDGRKTINAPEVVISKPGVKRGGYAHEDSIWITFHHTDKRNLKDIEEDVISKNYLPIPEREMID